MALVVLAYFRHASTTLPQLFISPVIKLARLPATIDPRVSRTAQIYVPAPAIVSPPRRDMDAATALADSVQEYGGVLGAAVSCRCG